MQEKAYIKEPYERDVEGAIAEIEEMRKHSGQMPDIT